MVVSNNLQGVQTTGHPLPSLRHGFVCLNFLTSLYMFSLTSIFTTRHWNNEVHHLHSTPQQVSLTKGLHAARAPTRPPTKWAEWLMPSLVPHAWICRTNKQAETFQQLCVVFQNAWCFCWNRNVKTDVRFKEVWTIATSPDLLVQYMYRFIYIYIYSTNTGTTTTL